jgi:hypothetical protein
VPFKGIPVPGVAISFPVSRQTPQAVICLGSTEKWFHPYLSGHCAWFEGSVFVEYLEFVVSASFIRWLGVEGY